MRIGTWNIITVNVSAPKKDESNNVKGQLL
jgi:hypothetical protein